MSYLDEDSHDKLTEYLKAKARYEGPSQVNRILNEIAKVELARMDKEEKLKEQQ